MRDEQSILWIFEHITTLFREESKNVSDREFVSIKDLLIKEKQRKISQLKRTLEYDMYDGTSRNDLATVSNAIELFFTTLTNGANNLDDITLFESVCKFSALFTFEMIAICEKSCRVGIICLGDNDE